MLLESIIDFITFFTTLTTLNLIEGKVQTFLTSTNIDGIHHQVIDKAKKIVIENGNVKGESYGRK